MILVNFYLEVQSYFHDCILVLSNNSAAKQQISWVVSLWLSPLTFVWPGIPKDGWLGLIGAPSDGILHWSNCCLAAEFGPTESCDLKKFKVYDIQQFSIQWISLTQLFEKFMLFALVKYFTTVPLMQILHPIMQVPSVLFPLRQGGLHINVVI